MIKTAYRQQLSTQQLYEDSAQLVAIEALNHLAQQLSTSTAITAHHHIKSLYFYGRVGRGKSMLMDLFYQQVPIKHKQRLHYHRFMQKIHQQLFDLTGTENPLPIIAKMWRQQLKLLCLDEFFVTDIGDAMILYRLLNAFWQQGIVIVMTSNIHPDALYQNGLQRSLFLPAIDLIKQQCDIVSIDGEYDYRQLAFEQQKTQIKLKHFIVDPQGGREEIAKRFFAQTQQQPEQTTVKLCNRTVNCMGKSEGCIWFDFAQICQGPRSQLDYIELADQYQMVMVSSVPQFKGKLVPAVFSGVEECYQREGNLLPKLQITDDIARRFIALVDELYDRKVQLVVGSYVELPELYQGEELALAFQRCCSRLLEMQTAHYCLKK
jgi:cell division protein ZapE